MIKKQHRDGTQNTNEYYLLAKNGNSIIYKGWKTIKEMAALPECEISVPSLAQRIVNMSQPGSQYKTLWQAVSTDATVRNGYNKAVDKAPSMGFVEFVNNMKLWPAGSMHTKALIVQGKGYDLPTS